jgi:hypothetical protein
MATISKDFTKSVLATVQQELGTLGFEKRKASIFTLPFTIDVLGSVGLNTATRRGAGILEINPVIGVRNQQIERLVAELLGEAFDELIPPTLAGNVGYLSPANRYLPFLFTEDTAVEEIANQLSDAVKTYGIPFMKKLTDLTALVEAMQTARFGMPFVIDYRIPAGLLLLGNRGKAKAFVAAKLNEIGTRNDPAALRYKGFASKLTERLAS